MNPFKLPLTMGRLALRTQQINWVLARYGVVDSLACFGIEVSRLGLTLAKGKKSKSPPPLSFLGTQLARTAVHLGPTFIKLGQMFATRGDIIGDEMADSLKVLFDRVPAMPFNQVKRLIESELQLADLKLVFKEIKPKPIGSASISQVHQGVLLDGTPVVIKVQKKGVDALVKADLQLLNLWINVLAPLYPRGDLKQVYRDFKEATLLELDYREEAKNIDRFRKNYSSLFHSDAEVVFPQAFPQFSTKRVLTLEPMHGAQVSTLKKGSTVARKAAALSLTAILEQVFEHGFFHADPHGGNLFFLEDNGGKIGFIDMGLVGQLDPSDKQKFLKCLLAILKRDRKNLARSLYDLGEPGKKTEYQKYEADIELLVDTIKKEGIEKYPLSKLVNKLLAIARKNKIYIPNRYVLMLRSFLVIEGVAKSLDPTLSIMRLAPPIVMKSLIKSYSPIQTIKKWLK